MNGSLEGDGGRVKGEGRGVDNQLMGAAALVLFAFQGDACP